MSPSIWNCGCLLKRFDHKHIDVMTYLNKTVRYRLIKSITFRLHIFDGNIRKLYGTINGMSDTYLFSAVGYALSIILKIVLRKKKKRLLFTYHTKIARRKIHVSGARERSVYTQFWFGLLFLTYNPFESHNNFRFPQIYRAGRSILKFGFRYRLI